jgi:hypothetical protein
MIRDVRARERRVTVVGCEEGSAIGGRVDWGMRQSIIWRRISEGRYD